MRNIANRQLRLELLIFGNYCNIRKEFWAVSKKKLETLITMTFQI